MTLPSISLTYRWPPDRVHRSEQPLLYFDDEMIITTQRVKPSAPLLQNGEIVLANNFPVVWFLFTGSWYSVAKVYNLEHIWTGYYCDIIEPVKRDVDANGQLRGFEITDLFLDLWINPDGSYEVQDEDEFEIAIAAGALTAEVATAARAALESLIAAVEADALPDIVHAVHLRGIV